ncbi:MAG TPA: SIMPL domain-containing protein [Thermoanaerobaculia bacterium]|nr:SIMPL domain-containing protein [Thermoanaerobaculia bacterium]
MKSALALLLMASPLLAADEVKHTIQVRGTGVVTVVPDRVSFTAGVATRSKSVKTAFDDNNRITQRVLQELRDHGVTDAQMRTANFSIGVDYANEQQRGADKFYLVQNTVTVTRDNTSDVAALVQASVDAGANDVSSVTYGVKDVAALRQTALERAYADARVQAQHLAAAAGKTIGEPIEITTEVFAMPTPMTESITVTAAPKLALEGGTRDVSATILVTFELK